MIGFIIGVIVGAAVATVVAVLGTRSGSSSGPCRLQKRAILPDRCVGGCTAPGQRCIALSTRSYALFGSQAASCGCAIET
jgi:hypothetical protein